MKWKTYPEYKESGIEWLGEIPNHWTLEKIKRLSLVKRGASPRPIDDTKYFDDEGEYSWVRISDVTASNSYLQNTTQRLSELGKSMSIALEPGEIFLSIAGSVGKPIITKIKCCIHDGFVYFPNYQQNKKFLYYIFASGQPYLGLGKLGTQLNLNTDTVADIHIGLPSLQEQSSICAFLDRDTAHIDNLIAKKQRQIELLQEKRSALISHVVTKGLDPNVKMKDSGVEWLGMIPEHWNTIRLKYSLSLPLQYGANEVSEYDEPSWPRYIRITDIDENGNLRNDTFKSLPEVTALPYLLKQGDLLFARSGATVGKTFMYKESWGRAAYAGYLIRANLNLILINPSFITYFCKSINYWDWLKINYIQATIQNVSAERYANLVIPVPSINEQNMIIEYLDSNTVYSNKLVEIIAHSTALLKEYRAALISAAVTGKIDVRQEVA